MADRIHLFGASGSGTTTLGEALAARLQILCMDCDSFYWKPTDPPFTEKNPPEQRVAMIRKSIADRDSWVLSGSLCSWGEALWPDFTLAVFLYLDPALRMRRLQLREQQRYGARIHPGGDMHQIHLEFMNWAASYDSAKAPTRSLDLHRQWRQNLACPIIELDSSQPLEILVAGVCSELDG